MNPYILTLQGYYGLYQNKGTWTWTSCEAFQKTENPQTAEEKLCSVSCSLITLEMQVFVPLSFLFRAAGFNSQLEAFMKVEIEMRICRLIRSMSCTLSCIFCSRNIYDNRQHNVVESCACRLDIQMMNMGIVGLTRRTRLYLLKCKYFEDIQNSLESRVWMQAGCCIVVSPFQVSNTPTLTLTPYLIVLKTVFSIAC